MTSQKYIIKDEFGDTIIFVILNNHRGETFTKYDNRVETYHGRWSYEYKDEVSFYNALRRFEKKLNVNSKYIEDGF